MSIFDHFEPSQPSSENGNTIPRHKNSCCMKYIIEKQCKRCPFLKIKDKKDMQTALDEVHEKRRGEYKWYDGDTDTDVSIEYNNQYR